MERTFFQNVSNYYNLIYYPKIYVTGDLGVSVTALSKDFKAIMYNIGLPIVYDAKIHSYVATEDFEIPWRVVNDEISELLDKSKNDIQELLKEEPDNIKLKHILENLKGIEN